jgi:hypothetical protein
VIDRIALIDIPRRAKDPIDLIARVLEETAMVEALVIINGRDVGLRKYWDLGGHIYPNMLGEPCIYGEIK